LLLPTAQTWSDQINHAVPAIAGFAAPARQAAPSLSSPSDKAGAPTVANSMAMTSADSQPRPIASKIAAPVPERRAIHIRAGDTFRDLAAKYLGSKDRAWDLIKANPQISDPDVLDVGETVYLPSTRNDQSRLVQ
jgi:hypothetical protein